MIQDTLRDVLKKWPANGPATPQNCVVGQKIVAHAHFFQNFLDVGVVLSFLKDFKVGVAHPRGEIGS